MKLEINSKKNNRLHINTWRMTNTLLNYHWAIEQIREEIEKAH
jgi:hypothetical protein